MSTSMPTKTDLTGNPTAGVYKTAFGQLYDFIAQYLPSDGSKPSADNITNTPAGNISATDVQAAINELGQLIVSLQKTWEATTTYVIGDICYPTNGTNYMRLECVVAGTTAAAEPAWTGVGTLVTDGTVTWIIDDIRDGALPGDICPPSMIVRPGRIKANGGLVNRADYPRLTKFATDNSLITTEAGWAAGLWGLFGAGDGGTTIRLPDLRGEHFRALDDGRGVDKTNITGNTTSASTTISGITTDTLTLAVGMPISGTGIPVGATIASIVSSTSITISAAATATATGVTLTVTGRVLGSSEADAIRNITGVLGGTWSIAPTGAFYGTTVGSNNNTGTGASFYSVSIDASRVVPTAPENRGRNVAYYATIKY